MLCYQLYRPNIDAPRYFRRKQARYDLGIYGYARVSTMEQHEDRQLTSMLAQGVPKENIFVEKASGKDFTRPTYQKMLTVLKKGDVLFLHNLDRLGRNYDAIIENWKLLTKIKGVDIVILDMPILGTRRGKDLIGTLIRDIILSLISYFAQSERDAIHKRQVEGIAAAKARGIKFGRPIKPTPNNFNQLVKQWERKKLNTTSLTKFLNSAK
jgi:DNA invertase Pin-like site-specific DNA recombinase